MSTIGFLLKRDQPDALQLCKRLVDWLRQRGHAEVATVLRRTAAA